MVRNTIDSYLWQYLSLIPVGVGVRTSFTWAVYQTLPFLATRDYLMLCFLAFAGLHGLLAASVLTYLENKHSGSPLIDWWRAQALDKTIDVINFINAVTATVLSSWVLLTLDGPERANVTGRKPSDLAGWAVESVCGYMVVELVLLVVSSYRLTRRYWTQMKAAYCGMVIFHVVALFGLTSVLLLDTGYPLAMWVIWSELTSVFLGVEAFLQTTGLRLRYVLVYRTVAVCGTLTFVFQRVVIFLYLLWLSWAQFTWKLSFIFQVVILIVGTVLNAVFAADLVAEWFRNFFTTLKAKGHQ